MGLATTYGVGQYAVGSPSESHTAGWDRAYTTGGRGLLWCHSAGSNSSQEPWISGNNTLPLFRALASLLGPIMSGDFAGEAFGNSPSQTLATSAWTWIKSQYGAKTNKVVVGGPSMGGLLALNWARANPALVAAVLLFYPAVNLQALYNGTGGAANFSTAIDAAYGGGAPSYPTYDPANGTNPAAYTGIPIYMGYSDADTSVGTANQTAWISAVGGSALTSRVYTGAAHADMTKIDVNDVTTWIKSYI